MNDILILKTKEKNQEEYQNEMLAENEIINHNNDQGRLLQPRTQGGLDIKVQILHQPDLLISLVCYIYRKCIDIKLQYEKYKHYLVYIFIILMCYMIYNLYVGMLAIYTTAEIVVDSFYALTYNMYNLISIFNNIYGYIFMFITLTAFWFKKKNLSSFFNVMSRILISIFCNVVVFYIVKMLFKVIKTFIEEKLPFFNKKKYNDSSIV